MKKIIFLIFPSIYIHPSLSSAPHTPMSPNAYVPQNYNIIITNEYSITAENVTLISSRQMRACCTRLVAITNGEHVAIHMLPL